MQWQVCDISVADESGQVNTMQHVSACSDAVFIQRTTADLLATQRCCLSTKLDHFNDISVW